MTCACDSLLALFSSAIVYSRNVMYLMAGGHGQLVMPHAFHDLIPIFPIIHLTTPNQSEPNRADSSYHYQ